MSVQMICPFCKREFPFNNGNLDKEIQIYKQRVTKISEELTDIKNMPLNSKKKNNERRKRLVSEKAKIERKLVELKTIRKATDQQRKQYEYYMFKTIVRERHGEEEFRKIIDIVEEEVKAYEISGLMWHEYTRSNSKSNVISINKL